MAENSKIAWCDDTVNLWWGCQEVAPECDHCYARIFANRVGKGRGWRDIRYEVPSAFATLDKLQRKAAKSGEPRTVFVQSMSDIFERNQQLVTWHGRFTGRGTADVRKIFFDGITEGKWPDLVFLLLTKRPGLINDTVPDSWELNWPPNVWTGTSVGVSRSIPQIERLSKVPGPHFVSFEPLLEPLNLQEFLFTDGGVVMDWDWGPYQIGDVPSPMFDWSIIGAESRGNKAGRLGPDGTDDGWNRMAANLSKQLAEAGVPTFVKQCPVNGFVSHDPNEWDERLRVRDFPHWRATKAEVPA